MDKGACLLIEGSQAQLQVGEQVPHHEVLQNACNGLQISRAQCRPKPLPQAHRCQADGLHDQMMLTRFWTRIKHARCLLPVCKLEVKKIVVTLPVPNSCCAFLDKSIAMKMELVCNHCKLCGSR